MSEISLQQQIDYLATHMREMEAFYDATMRKHGTQGLKDININIPANYNMLGAIKHTLLQLQELYNSERQEMKVIRNKF